MGEGWRSSWRVARQRSREGDLEMDIKDCEGSSSSDTGCDWGKMTIKRTQKLKKQIRGKTHIDKQCQTRRVDNQPASKTIILRRDGWIHFVHRLQCLWLL